MLSIRDVINYAMVFRSTMILIFLPLNLYSGEYAAEFLRIGIGARALGMGGAYVALANDGSAVYWNPAGLTNMNKLHLTFSHSPMFKGVAQHNFANVSLKIASQTNLAFSWIRFEVDDIPRFGPLQGSQFDRIRNPGLRSTGEAEGFFGDTEQAFLFSVGRGFDFDLAIGGGLSPIIVPARISVGVNFKYIRQALDEAVGSGQGIDLGMLIEFQNRAFGSVPQRKFSIGLAVKDIFDTTITWNTATKQRDTLPLNASIGFAYSEGLPWLGGRLTLTFHRDRRFGALANWGGEYSVHDFLAIRTGLQDGRFTAGAGIRVYKLQVDYAFVGNDLGNTHRISGCLKL